MKTAPSPPDLFGAVGNTPLIRLPKLSAAIGRTVLGKAEFLNPGGSVKDRAAKFIIEDAEENGRLRAGGTVVEGTAGNTGIALTMLGNARGYKTIIVTPDDQSDEKIELLRILGADVRLVPALPYSNPKNYYHVARDIAADIAGALWADQFNNPANARGHYQTTGPEIWSATGGCLDAFVAACGTGGTFAGVSAALKERKPSVYTVVADPLGSALFSFVKCGTLETSGDSITEGIGIKRITENFRAAKADDAIVIDDHTMVEMAYYLLHEEGLLLGESAALNVAAAARIAKKLTPASTVVTVLCDGGGRYLSRLYNKQWLAENGLTPTQRGLTFLESNPS